MAGERVGGVRTPVVIGAVVIALVIGLALGVLLGPDGDTPQLEPAPEPSTTTPSTLTEPPSPAEAPPGCTEEAFAQADGVPHVVLSRVDGFVDALGGAVLTGDAPLLFTTSGGLHADVAAEIDRLMPDGGTVYMLGGIDALTEAIEADLTDAGHATVRLAGPTRVETALAVADAAVRLFGEPDTVALARADVWADAITGGGWAAKTGQPVLVTQTDRLHPAVAEWLDARPDLTATALGGPTALSDDVVDQADAVRVAGPNRYGTAVAIAGTWPVEPAGFVIGNGDADLAWGYALIGAGLAADLDQPVLLVESDRLPGETDDATCGGGERAATTVVGPEALVAQSVRDQLESTC